VTGVAGGGFPDPDLGVAGRRSRILSPGRGGGNRGALIATVSTILVFGALGVLVVNSPGWASVKESFFNWQDFKAALPEILAGFWLNVQMFLVAEAIILVFALLLAVVRSLPGPVFFPLRALVIAFTDLFRGVPLILVIYLLGFGMPALDL